jgi:acyl carrier protein
MNENDALVNLLVEFFELPSTPPISELRQSSIAKWDSLAMVQLITEMQSTFRIQFDLDEIERLTSYDEIRAALMRKKVVL